MLGGTELANAGVYFYLHPGPYDPGYRHYAIHALAQGLRRAGVPLYSNFNAPGFIFSPFRSAESRLVVFSLTHMESWGQYAQAVASYKGHKFLLCMADFANQIVPPEGTTGLVAHDSGALVTQGDRLPWAFGYTDERLAQCSHPKPFKERSSVMLRNFRPSAAQGVRLALDLALLPHLEKEFAVDREIDQAHFDRLKSCSACLAYGGDFAENILRSHFYAEQPALKQQLSIWKFVHEPAICRWDSWRFWESLACGALTLHLDLEKYGCKLPVMPVAWKHYIPVDFAEPKATVERMMAEKSRWAEIAEAGREWAIQHYSPDAVASRFMELVKAPVQAKLEKPIVQIVSRVVSGAATMVAAFMTQVVPIVNQAMVA